jgi:DNA invertase Pin-like site-specific DNA recombinase
MERPAFKKLLQDIREDKVDCVVVYKADRLSRRLFDFTQIVEVFDQHKVSFISVTESFNTATAAGRLMFGMIMSFAQYERELTSERIRDKVAASKKKGMWMGGSVPLGYDAKEAKLILNEEEAKIIRNIFNIFIENESITETARELNRNGFTTKSWVSKTGRIQRGKKFNKQNIRRFLENQIYAGRIEHKNQVYDGLHEAIVTAEIWQKADSILNRYQENQIIIPKSRVTSAPLLKGIMSCGICGAKMIPTYTKKQGKRYRYYLCSSKAVGNNDSCKIARVSANEAENVVINQVLTLLKKPEFILSTIGQAVGKLSESVIINSFKQIEKVWDELFPVEQARIISLLIKDIEVRPEGLNIRIFKDGLHSLSNEFTN